MPNGYTLAADPDVDPVLVDTSEQYIQPLQTTLRSLLLFYVCVTYIGAHPDSSPLYKESFLSRLDLTTDDSAQVRRLNVQSEPPVSYRDINLSHQESVHYATQQSSRTPHCACIAITMRIHIVLLARVLQLVSLAQHGEKKPRMQGYVCPNDLYCHFSE